METVLKCKNSYDVLKVPKDVSDDDLKKAYQKLVIVCHPDKNKAPGAEGAFKVNHYKKVLNSFNFSMNPDDW